MRLIFERSRFEEGSGNVSTFKPAEGHSQSELRIRTTGWLGIKINRKPQTKCGEMPAWPRDRLPGERRDLWPVVNGELY
jgi:hypothetical protein